MVPLVTDEPVPGTYASRLVKSGPLVAIRISRDKDSGCYRIEVDGQIDAVPIEAAWPACARRPITTGEYRFMLRRAEWARTHQPEHPAANPRKRVDLRRIPPVLP
jgi:hypothetical protein